MNNRKLKKFLVSSGRLKRAYTATALLGVMLISLSPACAKEITYQGKDLSSLQTKAFFAGNKKPVLMLVPMDENKQPVASGNMLAIDYVPAGRRNELMIVSGGSAEKGEVRNNAVLLKNGKIKGFLYGGTGKDVAASDNIIHISGGETLQLIYGGAARNGAADNNEVHISGGVIKRTVFGGWIQEKGSANNNNIEITGGIFPGNSNAEGASVKSSEGEAHGNKVLITGSAKFEGPFSVFGGRSKKLSSHNQSVLIGTPQLATAEKFVVVGGINDLNGSIIPEANENETIIKGGYVTIERAYGGKSNGGNTLRNKLTFDGRGPEGKNASVEKILAGGHAKYVASYNDVTVIGGSVGERVAGGEVGENAGGLNYMAHYNTVNLHDAITFGGGEAPFFLLGGCQYNARDERALPVARPQLFTGNRLNLASDFSMSGKIDKLANFEFIDFRLPADTKDTLANQPQKSILSVEDADLTDGESGKGRNTKVQVLGIAQGGHVLTRGDKVLLIKADKSLTYNSDDHERTTIANEADGINGYLTQGLFLHRSEIVIDEDSRTVALDIVDSTTPPLTAANLAPMAVISDWDPLEFLDDVPENEGTFGVASFGGSHIKHEIGSHVKYNGYTGIAGIAKRHAHALWSVHFDGGRHTYDTFNESMGLSLKGEGTAKHYGVNIIGRIATPGGFYYDGALRWGRAKNSYSMEAPYAGLEFDTSVPYYGAALGLGYRFDTTPSRTFDVFARFAVTHQDGEDITLLGSPVNFDDITSKRLHLGLRHTWKNGPTQIRAGLGWQYEFDGRSDAKVAGVPDGESKSLEGGSVVEELAVIYVPEKHPQVSLGLHVKGYQGKTRGGAVSLKAQFDM